MNRNFLFTLISICVWLGGCFGGSDKKTPDKKAEGSQTNSRKEASAKTQRSTPKRFSQESSKARIVKNFSSSDPKKRAHAISAVRYWKWNEFLLDVEKALDDQSPLVQRAAIEALAAFENRDSTPKLYEIFQKSRGNRQLQESVLKAFVEISDDRTIPFLEGLLGKLDPALSSLTVEVLRAIRPTRKPSGESGRESIDSFTISGILGKGDRVKVQIGGEFFSKGDSVVGFQIESIDSIRRVVTLQKDGKTYTKGIDVGDQDPVEKAIQATQGSNDQEVYQALVKLASYRDPRPAAELVSLLKGDNPETIRLGALYAAGMCGIIDAIGPISDILSREKRSDFLILGIDALVRIGDERAVDSLIGLAKHRNPWVKNAVINGLGTMASEVGLPTIVGGLFDDYTFVRNNAYHQLKQLSDLGMVGEISKLLTSFSITEEGTLEARMLGEYLSTLPDFSNQGGDSNPFVVGPSDGSSIKKNTKVEYKPKFIIVNLGNWFGKNAVTVIEQGETRKVYEGGIIEGMKVLKIDPDDALVHLELPNGRTALVEQTDESTPAAIYEIQ